VRHSPTVAIPSVRVAVAHRTYKLISIQLRMSDAIRRLHSLWGFERLTGQSMVTKARRELSYSSYS
jgi:hypothetical protein